MNEDEDSDVSRMKTPDGPCARECQHRGPSGRFTVRLRLTGRDGVWSAVLGQRRERLPLGVAYRKMRGACLFGR